MNDRQRFIATMHYQPRDRAPICDFGFWPETIDAWHRQGLPEWVAWSEHTRCTTDRAFGMDRFSYGPQVKFDLYSAGPQVNCGLYPPFEERVLEDRGDQEVVQQSDGVRVLRHKYAGSIPMHLGHLLVDRASWHEHYLPRLTNYDDPARYPNWTQARAIWSDPDYPYPRNAFGGSLYGWLRDWMGVDNLSYLVHDDPAWFEGMVITIADLVIETHRRALAQGAQWDACGMWEDMCYNGGPLLGPAHFRRYLAPQYRRITDQLRRHGCDVIWVDSDGRIDELIALWMDAGVNCMFPLEVGTWHADPIVYRRRYGKNLLMMGGFDKHILARGHREIEAEIRRLTPLVEEGGYIGFCDHRVPPDVPLDHYLFYLRTVRTNWGKNTQLKPWVFQEPQR